MSLQTRLSLSGDPLYLMDGTAFVYRSFYAQRHLQRSDGFPTNALVLVTRLLLKILREERPKYFLFVMDGRGHNFRRDIYAEYKANREKMPEELSVQIEPVQKMVRALGLRLKVASEHEADDSIASLAFRFRSRMPVVIISGDKDLKQCLGPDVVMWDPGAKEDRILTAEEFTRENGVTPAQWPDVQALVGDSSDNIPGVPGIGPKTARQIFEICPTLEDIRDHFVLLPPRLQAKLQPHLEEMFRWRQLTTLLRDREEEISLEDLRTGNIDLPQCASLIEEFEMPSVRRDISLLAGNRHSNQEIGRAMEMPAQMTQCAHLGGIDELPDARGREVAVIWADSQDRQPRIALTGGQPGGLGEEIQWTGSMQDLCLWLQAADRIVVEDLKSLSRAMPSWNELLRSRPIAGWLDLGLAAYLCNPEAGEYSWPKLASRWKDLAPGGETAPASLALAVAGHLRSRLAANDLLDLYEKLELPLIPVLAAMERTGFAIDPKAFLNFLQDVDREADKLADMVFEEAGEKFNIRSAQQIGDILFGRMGLAAARKTRGGQPSTSQLALEKLAPQHPVVEHLLQFRKLDKMRATYLDPLPRLMDARDRIHTTFNQKATATGRLSSSNPNLQNIPVRGDLGERMRKCFVAGPGNALAAADYSQIELRVLAHFSRDPTLLAAFRKGEDIHAATAALILDCAPDAVTADQRRLAKTINFGLLYGMGAQKLAQELRIGVKEARAFIERYFSSLGALKSFYEEIIAGAREKGYVTTMTGRRRWLPGIASANGQIAAQAERQAVNTVIQGSAADIMKLAMLAVAKDEVLAELDAALVLQVHDELLLEAPINNARAVCSRAIELMQNVKPAGVTLSVPLLVEGGIGHSWGDAH